MSNSLSKIKLHWVAILLSVFFGFLVSSPHLLSLYKTSDFQGVYQTFNDEETYYQARVSEVVRGNWMVSNVYIKEHQNDLFLVPPIAEWIIASFSILLGISVPFAMVLNDIIFTVISFLFFYCLFFKVLNSRFHSLLYSSVFYLLFIHILGRPVNPQLTNVFFLSGLFLMYKIYYKEGKVDVLNFILGINIGLALFISPYYGSALGLLYFILNILKPIFEEGIVKTLKSIKYFLVTILPFAFGYAFLMGKVSRLPDYTDSSIRFGLINTHYIGAHTNILLALLSFGLVWMVLKTLNSRDKWLVFSIISSIFVLNWQNVVTGQLIQFSSHYYMIVVVFVFIVVAIVHKSLNNLETNDLNKYRFFVSVFLIFVIFSFIFYKQYNEIKALWRNIPDEISYLEIQKKAEVFDWINKNTEDDSVFYTLGGDYDSLIPIYTDNKVYYNFYATLSIMPNSETENRWLNQELFNNDLNKDYILDNQRDFWCNTFIDSYHLKENRKKILSFITRKSYVSGSAIESSLIEDLFERYILKTKKDPIEVIKEYDVDYILLSPDYNYYKETLLKLNKNKSIEKKIEMNSVVVFKVN